MAFVVRSSSYREPLSKILSLHLSPQRIRNQSFSTLICHPTLSSHPKCHSDPTTLIKRQLSKSPFEQPSIFTEKFEAQRLRRNKNIIMNPDGIGKDILPGNYVVKKHAKTGQDRKVLLEHEKGYFWAIKELSMTNNKPILCNESIIPAAEAEKFPTLTGLHCLNDEIVNIPDFFTRNNESKDATAQCTLVTISLKDFGAKLLPSWTTPFNEVLRSSSPNKYEIIRITINEGRIAKLLSSLIVSGTKKNVPEEDWENTLLYYGEAEEMRDVLRMHNVYTGYVYLVDGIGRVRWAGSGEGTAEEVQNMIECAKELTKPPQKVARQVSSAGPGPRVGKKVVQHEL